MRGFTVFVAGTMCAVTGRLPAQPPAATSRLTPQEVVVVRPLFFIPQPGGQATGACLGARLVIGGAPPGWVRIGVYEPEVGGTTDVWRATAWSAALVAAQLTGFDSRALQMSVEVGRSTDGPSAGALLTAAIVSAIRGDELRDGVTMTGTINPDGTIGPVSGIPLKLEGAAQAGQKVVLVPFGQESEVDPRSGQAVNVVQHGRALGIEVRAVRDIWEAYDAMTGTALPRRTGGSVPRPTAEFSRLIQDRIQRWVKLQRAADEKYNSWPAFTHNPSLDQSLQSSRGKIQESLSQLAAGDALAAYVTAAFGTAEAWGAHEGGRYVYQVSTGSVAGWNQLPAQNDWLLKELQSTTDAMRAFQPRTFDQMAMYLEAASLYYAALCMHEAAEDLKSLHHSQYFKLYLAELGGAAGATNDELRQATFSIMAGVFQIVSWLTCKLTTDALELASQLKGRPLSGPPDLVRYAEHYRRGAEANLALVNQLVIEPRCRQNEIPFTVAQRIMPVGDLYYGVANVGITRVMPALHTYLGEGEQLQYVRLAAAMFTQSVTSGLIGKHYSIGVEMGDLFKFKRVLREAALQDWLAQSRRQAEGAIQALVDDGIDTSTCSMIYWTARNSELNQNPTERFDALQGYFRACMTAELLASVARTESPDAAAAPPAATLPPAPPPAAPPAVTPGVQ